MINDGDAVSKLIDQITLEEDLNSKEDWTSSALTKNSHLKNSSSELIKPWQSPEYVKLLHSYFKLKYGKSKEEINLSNDFAEKVYVKTYYTHIEPANTRFDLPQKILYHPYVSKIDYEFVNQQLLKGSMLQMYTSLATLTAISIGLYATNGGRMLRQNPKKFLAYVGLPPILSIIAVKYLASNNLQNKLEQQGLIKKYSLDQYES